MRLGTILDLGLRHKLSLPAWDLEALRPHVQVTKPQPGIMASLNNKTRMQLETAGQAYTSDPPPQGESYRSITSINVSHTMRKHRSASNGACTPYQVVICDQNENYSSCSVRQTLGNSVQ